MTLINPVQLMNIMGTSPDKKTRSSGQQRNGSDFGSEMNNAMRTGMQNQTANLLSSVDGSVMQDALMQDALNGLANVMGTRTILSSVKNSSQPLKRTQGLGDLSAKFESGDQGVEAIGYDGNGGTSYGTYQIASKPGTMKAFIKYLETAAPEWASKLKAAGPTDTGSTKGRMPNVWRAIAAENPQKFGALQRDFIETSHYEPARDSILARTGVDMDTMPTAAQEALWSTAVQHGPAGAANIFGRIIKSINGKTQRDKFAEKLIAKVYDDRKRQFGSSTLNVQNAVSGRMDQEKRMVLAMLNNAGQASA